MTISTEVRKAGPFIGNDSASVFPFAFKVFKAADLIVVRRQDNIGTETTLVLDSDYHVTLNSNQDTTPGGVVTLVAGALASGFTLVVSSELPYLQPTDLTNQGGFYPKVVTNALDRLTIFCQQLAEITGRTLKLPITAPTNISAEIPLPNPSELIAWDETGTRLTTVSPQSLVTSIAYGSAAADLFAGDGVTTTFPLSTNPASVNNLDVSVGGFSQRPVQGGIGDYSWNGGASITFVTPPPAPTVPGDKNVLVRYMQAIPVSDSEALHAQTREALRRSYADAGLNLVEGSFEEGGELLVASDVMITASGAGYSWGGPEFPHNVVKGTDPTAVTGYVPRTDVTLRSDINVVVKRYASVEDMVNDATLIIGQRVAFDSYYAGAGVGGNEGVVVAASTGTPDGGSFITLASGLQVKGLFADKVTNPYQFGAKGDGVTDDITSLQNNANFCFDSGYLLDLCSGEYVISSELDFVANQASGNFEMPYAIRSDGRNSCKFIYTGSGGTAISIVSTTTQKNIANGIIDGGFKVINTGSGEKGVHFLGINNWEIENLYVSGFTDKQILLESNNGKGGLWNRLENTYVYGGNYGLYIGETANANTIDQIFAGGCAIDQIYTQGDRTQIYSLSIDDGGKICRSGIYCAGTTTIFGVEIEMGGTTGNTNFLGAIYGGGSANDYLTVYNFTAVGVTPRYAWNNYIHVVIYPSRSSTSTGNGLEIIASGDIKAPNIRLQPKMRVITNTLRSGVSSAYSEPQSLWNGGYGDFTIDTKTVKIVNNTNVSLDFQIRYFNTSDENSSVFLLKSAVAAGATLTLTTEEINQLMQGFSADVILKGLIVRVRTASASYTGTINSTITGLQF